tara:strand:- start:11229 stop:12203 length:975 start_codon:yes stop_codon:yes gene_type:complete
MAKADPPKKKKNKKKQAGLIASGTAASRTSSYFDVVDKITKRPKPYSRMPHGGSYAFKTGSKTFGKTWVRSVDMIKEAGNPKGLRATTFNFKQGTLGHKLVGGKSLIFKEQGSATIKQIGDYWKRLDAYADIMGGYKIRGIRGVTPWALAEYRAIDAKHGKIPAKPRIKSKYKFTNVVIGGGKKYPELKPGRPIGGHLGSLKRPVVSVHKDWAFVATNELPYPDTKWRKKWIGTQHVPQGSRLGQAITSRGTPEVAKMVRKAKPVLKAVGKVGTGLSGVGTAWAAYDAIKWAQQWHEENPGAVLKLKEEAKFQPGTSGKYGVDY